MTAIFANTKNLPPSSTKVKTSFMSVTPAMAMNWLEKDTERHHNRPTSQPTINAYARDMAMGRWRTTHQGISIAGDGTIIDGQHRLWAVVESKATVILQVTIGLPLSSQSAVDGQRVRSTRDVIALQTGSTTLTSLHVGIGRLISTQLGNERPTREEQVDCYNIHAKAIHAAVAMFPRRVLKIMNASTCCVIARATYTCDHRDLSRFVQLLTDGVIEGPREERDTIPILLRNLLLERTPRKVDVYRKTSRALRAFIDGERITNIYAATFELFLLPGEKPPTTREMKGNAPDRRRARGAALPPPKPTGRHAKRQQQELH